jgi:hypothetical protein
MISVRLFILFLREMSIALGGRLPPLSVCMSTSRRLQLSQTIDSTDSRLND